MYLGVDLGSTNIKAAIYDGSMQLVGQQSRPVEYLRENGFVEFDAERYYNELAALIAQLTRDCGVSKIRQIAFTGQAESLVCVDAEGRACMLPLATVNKAAFIFMQALGRPVESAGLSFFREVLLAVPLVLLLPRAFGLMGVLYSMPAADIVTFLASAVVLVRTDRQLRK